MSEQDNPNPKDQVQADSGLKNIPATKPKKRKGTKSTQPKPKGKLQGAKGGVIYRDEAGAIPDAALTKLSNDLANESKADGVQTVHAPHIGIDIARVGKDKSVATLMAPSGLSGKLEAHAYEIFDTSVKRTLAQRFWGSVWNMAERKEIKLGRFAPYIFERMIGKSGKRL